MTYLYPIEYNAYTENAKQIQEAFGLVPPKLYSTKQMYSAGACYSENIHAIVVAQWVIDNAEGSDLIKVLGHELAHALQMTVRNDPKPKQNRWHSLVWAQCMRDIGLEPLETMYELNPRLALHAPMVRRKGLEWFRRAVLRNGLVWVLD